MEVYLPYETPTGPQLEVLGEVETKLPQPVQRRATAWVLTAAVAPGRHEAAKRPPGRGEGVYHWRP